MKIAVALFGIPRGSQVTMPTIRQHFIDPAAALGDSKVFYHLYLQDRVESQRSGENHPLPRSSYDVFAEFTGELEPPEACLGQWQFERLKQFGDEHDDGFSSLRNLVHQLHSLRQVTALVAAYEPDVVLFLRPDLHYEAGWEPREIESVLRDPRRCILPAWQWWSGYNDRFALCGREAFGAYGRRIERAIEFCERRHKPLQAERLLRYALKRDGVHVRMTDIRASRVRTDGTVKEEIFRIRPTVGPRRHLCEWAWLHWLSRPRRD